MQELRQIIAQLRNPEGGCPWDLKQTFQTMIPHLLKESYEVVEAIEQQDVSNLREELGDLLLQVVFLSQLAQEAEMFTFDEVIEELKEKLIRRHPHVFANETAQNEEEALANWNKVKAKEHQEKGATSILDDIPQAFPALMRAEKLQKRCAKVGFDWPEIEPVFAKVAEELQEVRAEVEKTPRDPILIQEEMGDLFFAVVNLSRQLACPSEETLRQANAKFARRFRQVEQKLKAQGKTFAESHLVEMDMLWEEVKCEEKAKKK